MLPGAHCDCTSLAAHAMCSPMFAGTIMPRGPQPVPSLLRGTMMPLLLRGIEPPETIGVTTTSCGDAW